jgi:rfaE bifunctional protein kinase chain/domain
MNFNSIFNDFNKLKVMVLGDSMLDAYFYGNVERISPEAPVPIVNLKKKEHRLGGASNVALNLKALGAEPLIVSIKGNDRDGDTLKALIKAEKLRVSGLINDYNRCTTVKTRIIGNNHQLVRVDEEATENINKSTEDLILDTVKTHIKNMDVVILQDYNKGMLTKNVIKKTIALCNKHKVKTVVDPKFDNFFEFKHCTLFKPNKKEILGAYNVNSGDTAEVTKYAKKLRKELNAEMVMTTLSADGAILVADRKTHNVMAHPRKIVDVSGAGDSVVAVAALCEALDLPKNITLELANLAGGLVCEHVGVVPIDKDVLFSESMELMMEDRIGT